MMSQPAHCSKCDHPLTQVGQFWVCPQHGQVSPEKPFVPLRVFLSYGHDVNEELVRRIKADLEKRGHDVWFDKTEIKGGDDWRRSITDGITDSHRVLSFLSKHSTRDPGVCRDEIAIAIGVKGGNMPRIANPLGAVINGGRQRYLIVIDALDEAGEAGRNPLVEMLARDAQRLPDWIGVVATSRPEFDVKTPLQGLNPFPLDTKSESNLADIRDIDFCGEKPASWSCLA